MDSEEVAFKMNLMIFGPTQATYVARRPTTDKVMRSTPVKYKNLAIANRSRVSCINTNNNTMALKLV